MIECVCVCVFCAVFFSFLFLLKNGVVGIVVVFSIVSGNWC